ncbi:SecDF P1 head subdomain-containing protein [Pengzhenrongella frigida]|uniref:SecDF P1 head subdomain domain-containing protein n=1 Tax=Pengzhenrongella frigida TaxID=1259133 RepID=A0A4V1ZHK8_9MICO|nr:hypothetical protein [Cellulomonas sp. HLT2-17]RYV52394.1 hypothetical protein EUA98_04115 [Cellulomonas sp. HLT2-17]
MTATDPTDRPTASRTSLALREITAADPRRRRAPCIIEYGSVDVSDITSKAIDKQLAILLNGKVVSAATVKDPITTGNVTLGFGTASEADQVASELSASTTS